MPEFNRVKFRVDVFLSSCISIMTEPASPRSPEFCIFILTKEGMNMKKFWIAAMAATLITVGAVAQTSASGSASGNASVTPGQANVGASANQSAQTPNGSANVGTSAGANANASHEHDSKKKDSGSTNGAGVSGGSATSAVAGTEGHGVSSGLNGGTAMQAELT